MLDHSVRVATDPPPPTRLRVWESRLEWPLTSTALIFLAAYAWDVLYQPQGDAEKGTQYLIWATWAVFAIDYLVRLVIAPQRHRWFFRHLLDLAIVALPLLRPLRLLRLIILLSTLQRAAGSKLHGRVAVYVIGSTAVLVGVGALAMLEAERHAPGTEITTYGQAVWWALVTITTVGYGDKVPVSDEGHFIAVGLMIGGIALLGTVTAWLASWLVDKVRDEGAETATASQIEMAQLTAEVRALRQALERALPALADEITSPSRRTPPG